MRRFVQLCITALFLLLGIQVVKASCSIQSESGLGLGAGFSQGKAEDAGGLTPVKDDNVAMRKSSPKTSSIFGRMEHSFVTGHDFSTALHGGYTLALSLQGDDNWITVQKETREEYALATRKVHRFMVHEGNRPSGELVLTLYTDPTSGTLYFLENRSAVPVELNVTKQGCSEAVTLHELTYGTAEGAAVRTVFAGSGFRSETSLYLEGDGLFVQSGRTVRLEPKGNTVCKVDTAETGTAFSIQDGVFTLRTRIAADGAAKACYHGAVCTSPLVDWNTPHRAQKIVSFDTTNEYLFLADGHYYEKPSDYFPCVNEEGRFVYQTAASFVHKSAIEPNSGAYLRLLGLYLLYTRMESFREAGYIPTPCESQWLKSDYGNGVTRTGEMIRDDYVSVTYNDLVAAVKLFDGMGYLERYPGLYALLMYKEAWLAGSEEGAACITGHP